MGLVTAPLQRTANNRMSLALVVLSEPLVAVVVVAWPLFTLESSAPELAMPASSKTVAPSVALNDPDQVQVTLVRAAELLL